MSSDGRIIQDPGYILTVAVLEYVIKYQSGNSQMGLSFLLLYCKYRRTV